MNCDQCDKPAVVHEVTVKGGVKTEVHLCEDHAAAAGFTIGTQAGPIDQLLTQFVVCNKTEKTRRSNRMSCRTCGTSFSKFRRTGLLGCPDCYTAFERHLAGMIERAQNGASSHAGKCPRRGGASIDRQLRIQRLFKELEDAVASEQYERAAELRDRLRDLKPDMTPPGAATHGSADPA
jgi:protein arginine kinase activator